MHGLIDAGSRHGRIDLILQQADARRQEVLKPRADDVERQVEDEAHDGDKGRDSRVLARQYLVDAAAALVLAALVRLVERAVDELADEGKAHVRDGRRAVEAALLLHLADDVLNHLHLVLVEHQRLDDAAVTLDDLRRGEADRDARFLRVVLDEVHDAVQAAMHGAAMALRIAEVHAARLLLIMCDVQRVRDELLDALALGRRDRHDRDAEQGLHRVDVDRAAVARELVHHVEREDHRAIELDELQRQVEVALDVRRIDDVDDARWLLAQDELTRDNLLVRVRRHRVDARQIRDLRVLVAADAAALLVDRDAWEIADVLVRARQLVKKRRLAAVLVARERERQQLVIRQRVLTLAHMVAAALAEARMVRRLMRDLDDRMLVRLPLRQLLDADLLRIVDAQRQLILVDAELDRVPHRGELHQRDLRPRYHAHVEEVLPQRPLPADRAHHRPLTGFQFI